MICAVVLSALRLLELTLAWLNVMLSFACVTACTPMSVKLLYILIVPFGVSKVVLVNVLLSTTFVVSIHWLVRLKMVLSKVLLALALVL